MSNFMKIRNGINLGYLTADPSTGMSAGDMYYNGSTNLLRLYDGISWTTVQNTPIDTTGFLKADGSVPLAGTFTLAAEDTYEIGGNSLPGVDNAVIHRIWTNRLAGTTKIQGSFNDTQTDDMSIATNATNLANGNSGQLAILTGSSDSTDDSGDELGSGNTGNINIITGQTATGDRGSINLQAGGINIFSQSNNVANGSSPQVNLGSGTSDLTPGSGSGDGNGTTGDVFISTGQTTGTRGQVHLQGSTILLDGNTTINGALNMGGTGAINNVVDPVSNQDVATKHYVDTSIAAIPGVDLTPYLKHDGSVPLSGSLVPDTNNAYNLGSSTNGMSLIYAQGAVINGAVTAGAYQAPNDVDTIIKARGTGQMRIQSDTSIFMDATVNMDNLGITSMLDPVSAQDAATKNYVDTQAVLLTQKGAANGVATLGADSKIPSSQIPALAINETYVVANQAARLALAADVGDIAVETDNSTTYILQTLPASTNANWVALLTPPSAVTSVNTQTGNVVLTTDNVAQGTTNLYYTDAAAKAAAVVNSTAGTQTDQAASVSSMKTYVAAQIATVTVADATTTTKGIVQLAGDLAGTAAAPTVATVGTSTAANIHTAEVLANAATSGNVNNTIVKRDSGGAVQVSTLSASLINNSGGQVFINTGSGSLLVQGAGGTRITTDGTNFLNQNYYDSFTLAANTSTPTEISSTLSFVSANFSAAKIDYVVKEATSGKTIMGTLMIANDGTSPSCTDMRSETASIGTLAFDAAIVSTNVVIRFTGTDTTNASTMRCYVTKFRA